MDNSSDETSALTRAELPAAPAHALPVGAALGPYEVVALLGAGGMGEVYRARDPRLGREVAVKVIRAAEPSRETLLRFDQEARAAGALNHPNLLVVFDVGVQDGVPFVVTELLEGETLRDRLRRGPLPAVEAMALVRQALAGLDAAHRKGIVHRDLKPENLFLTADGRVKILDFGLAKRLDAPRAGDESLTGAGTMLGTVGYMSPEQLSGQPALPASDLFALGAVLYEMVSGRRAFAGGNPLETLGRVLTAEPPPLAAAGAPGLARIVERCLAKRPAARYASVAALVADLDALGSSASNDVSSATTGVLPTATRSLAVLPFLNLSGDPGQDYFCEGLAEELIHALSRLEGLRVAARSSSFRFKGQDDAIARVARELHVEAVLEGSLRRAGERLRINVQLVDTGDGCHLWSERYDRAQGDVFAIQEEIAANVVEALRLRLAKPPAAPRRPASLDAYHLYLKGRHLWNKRHAGGLRSGVAAFEQAIELDAGYALAWAGLADSYALMGYSLYDVMPNAEAIPRAKAAAQRAIELDPELADPHAALGWVRLHYDWDWEGAERAFRRAIELDPRRATTRHWYSFLLSVLGRFDAAQAQARDAWELDPLSLIVNGNVAQAHYHARRLGEAEAAGRKLVELEAGFPFGHYWLGTALAARGAWRAALPVFETFRDLMGAGARGIALVAMAQARLGNAAAAHEAIAELQRRAVDGGESSYSLALVHLGLGEKGAALADLERAVEERNDSLVYLAVEPLLDPLRGEPRFARLLDRVGLTAVAARLRPATVVTATTLGDATRPSVAVLPFRDLAGEAASAHLRLGLADATITELARHRGLVVRPTSAVLRYQEGAVEAGAAARELGVDTVVEGSFLRAGGRLRVTLQLIRVADGASAWGTKVEGDADDLFSLQDEVARQVSVALLPSRSPAAAPAPRAAPAGAAYDLYLQGRSRLARESLADYVAAINLFERARDADPSFALGWAGLADAYARMGYNFQPEGDWHRRAHEACEQALRLDPALPEGRYARGRLFWTPQQGWDHAGAIRDLLAAVTAMPGFADAHQRLGTVLYHVGLVDEAERHLEQTLAINPAHLSGLGQLAFCRCHRGSFVAALAPSLEVARTMAPWDIYQVALCQLRLGQHADAAASAARIEEAHAHHPLAASIRGVLAAGRGDSATAREEARRIVAERAAWGHYHHAQYDLACIHALLGEPEAAVDELEAAAANGYPCGPFFAIDPLLASLHREPRFTALLARLEAERAGYARLYDELQRCAASP